MDDGLTCGSCRHWKRQPIDPANLTAPPSGQCRYGPPSVTAVAVGTGQLMPVVLYPPLPAAFPACAQHAFPPADPPRVAPEG